MGKIYQEQVQGKVAEIGGVNVRAYINPQGFEPEYREHIIDTLRDLGATLVVSREEANFVLEGRATPQLQENQVTAYLDAEDGRMAFAGAWDT